MNLQSPENDILRSLVHDLSNALQATVGHAELGIPCRPEAIQLALQIVQRMKEELFSQRSTDAIQPFLLSDWFADFDKNKHMLEVAFGVQIGLTHNVSEGCAVMVGVDLARQVPRNLIANAAAAGAKTIKIHYHEDRTRKTVMVVFADDGCGMEVTEPTLSPAGRGVHGTDIVRGLIAKAGGLVDWFSRPGIGTTVTIRLILGSR